MSLLILNQMAAAIARMEALEKRVEELERVVTHLNTKRPVGRPPKEERVQ